MKTLYVECNMGAAGDMLTAALLELTGDKNNFLNRMNTLGLKNVSVSAESSVKRGIAGISVSVKIYGDEEADHHGHGHAGMTDIAGIIDGLPVSEYIKKNSLAVYNVIADAESEVHGRPVNEIHFHELGSLDAIADIVGVCMLMEELTPEKIVVSPVHVGCGTVRCAHGELPVPAPATARILRGVPVYGGSVRGELCTPTGAALLAHFADSFGDLPVMRITKIGYGMGKKDFEAANCVRVFLGETDDNHARPDESIAELRCNVDDMTGESIGFAVRTLMGAGARDAFTSPAQMKKDRPGTLITCVCEAERADEFAALLLRHTTTFGVRKSVCGRYTLGRGIERITTPLGEVGVKTGRGFGIVRRKPEYDDVAALALKNGLTFGETEKILYKYINTEDEFK